MRRKYVVLDDNGNTVSAVAAPLAVAELMTSVAKVASVDASTTNPLAPPAGADHVTLTLETNTEVMAGDPGALVSVTLEPALAYNGWFAAFSAPTRAKYVVLGLNPMAVNAVARPFAVDDENSAPVKFDAVERSSRYPDAPPAGALHAYVALVMNTAAALGAAAGLVMVTVAPAAT
jgi:hypothetical protein